MLIEKLFPPRWKHKNPQLRKRALQTLDPLKQESQKIYQEVLESDPELFVRRIAIQGLTSIEQLQALRQSDEQGEIIEEATSRICHLLSTSNKQRPVSFLKNILSSIGETRILEYVALHANDEDLQLYALNKVVNESVLIELLNSTKFNNNKKHVLQKLGSANSLKRAIKFLKRKDTVLASQAQEKLETILNKAKQTAELQKEGKRTATELLELMNLCKYSDEWEKYETRLRKLHDRFIGQMARLDIQKLDTEKQLSRQVDDAYSEFEEHLQQAKQRRAEKPDWQNEYRQSISVARPKEFDQLTELLLELEQSDVQELPAERGALESMEKQNEQRLAEVEKKWEQACKKLVQSELTDAQLIELDDLKSRFKEAQKRFHACLLQISEIAFCITALEAVKDRINTLLESEQELDIKQAEQVLNDFNAIKTPERLSKADGLMNVTKQLAEQLKNRKSEKEKQYAVLSDEFSQLVVNLEEALRKGKAKTVKQLINRGRNILNQLPGRYLSDIDAKGQKKKFHQCVRNSESLLDWQQWSTSTVKEQLIKSMEELAALTNQNLGSDTFDFSAAASEIKQARGQWKQASASTASKDEKLWAIFDAACNKAYEPCQNYFDRENELRKQNLEEREKVCQDLEKYFDSVSVQSSDEVNWKALDKITRIARQDWEKLGTVNRGDRTAINNRFHEVLNKLEKLSRKRKDDNRDEKLMLISRIETTYKQLQEKAIGLENATEAVKQAQVQWKAIGPARKDKQLWEKFRAVCDSVFEIRSAEQQQIKEQEQAINAQRQQILDKIKDCSERQGEALLQARADIDQLQSEWRALPKLKKGHSLDRRFVDACKIFSKNIQIQRDQQLREVKQQIQQNVACCYQLEMLINEFLQQELEPGVLQQKAEEQQNNWKSVNEKSLSFSKAIEERYLQAKDCISALLDGRVDEVNRKIAEQHEANVNTKEDLCIKLEILANQESPHTSKQRRLELQVLLLAEKMQQKSTANAESELQSLLSQWHTSGFILTPESFNFEQRFYSALKSLDKDYQYPI